MSAALVRWSAVLAAILLATGCVVSLHPLYRDQELVSVPDLTGRWSQRDDRRETWTFQRSAGSLYRLTIDSPDDPEPLTFEAGLVRLGEYLFLDIKPDHPVIKRYALYVVSFHAFGRIWVERNAFLIRPLDGRWFSWEAFEGRIDLAYIRLDEDFFLLTAPTRDLQRFALQYATDGEAFPRAFGTTFVRTEGGP